MSMFISSLWWNRSRHDSMSVQGELVDQLLPNRGMWFSVWDCNCGSLVK